MKTKGCPGVPLFKRASPIYCGFRARIQQRRRCIRIASGLEFCACAHGASMRLATFFAFLRNKPPARVVDIYINGTDAAGRILSRSGRRRGDQTANTPSSMLEVKPLFVSNPFPPKGRWINQAPARAIPSPPTRCASGLVFNCGRLVRLIFDRSLAQKARRSCRVFLIPCRNLDNQHRSPLRVA